MADASESDDSSKSPKKEQLLFRRGVYWVFIGGHRYLFVGQTTNKAEQPETD